MDRQRTFQVVIAVCCYLSQFVTAHTEWGYFASDSHIDTTLNNGVSSSYSSVSYYMHHHYTPHFNPSSTSSHISNTDWPNYDWYTSVSESSSLSQSFSSATAFITSPTTKDTPPYTNYTTPSMNFNGTTDVLGFQTNANSSDTMSPNPTDYFTAQSNITFTNSSNFYETSEIVTSPTQSNDTSTYSSSMAVYSSDSFNILNTTATNTQNISAVNETIILASMFTSVPISPTSSMPVLSTIKSDRSINQDVNSSLEITDSPVSTDTQTTPSLADELDINETSVLEVTKTTIDTLNNSANTSEISQIPMSKVSVYLSTTPTISLETSEAILETNPYNKSIPDIDITPSLNSISIAVTVVHSKIQIMISSSAVLETSFLTPITSSVETTPTTNLSSTSAHTEAEIQNNATEFTIITSTIEQVSLQQVTDSVLKEITSTTIHVSDQISQILPEYISITSSSSFTTDISSQGVLIPEPLQDYRIIITFVGTCGKIKDNKLLKIEFIEALVDVIQNLIPKINESNIELEQFICDPFTVVLLLKNIKDQSYIEKLQTMVKNITVPIIDNTIIKYHANAVKLLPVTNTTGDGGNLRPRGLETSDIVVIVISALLFAFLLLLGGIAICRECYKRKRAASFNLLEVPHVNVKMDDFSLTRIPRPKMSYYESNPNPIVTNGRHKVGDKGINGHTDDMVKVNSDNIHVRMRDHSDGLVIGVTCMPIKNDTNGPPSETSSPTTPCMDQAEQSLIKEDRSEHGTTNPNCSVDDEDFVKHKTIVQEDGKEEFL